MLIYLFASDSHPAVSAFAPDKTAYYLPANYAPWRPVNNGRPLHIDAPSDPIAAAIRQDGYSLLGTTEQAFASDGCARVCSHLNTSQREDLNQSSEAAIAMPSA
jgi:hypothetical protein